LNTNGVPTSQGDGLAPAPDPARLLRLVQLCDSALPIGHTHGQQVLARLQPHMMGLASRWADAPLDCFGGLSPAYEVLGDAQTRLYARLFQS
jgi:urease accessory protein UreF